MIYPISKPFTFLAVVLVLLGGLAFAVPNIAFAAPENKDIPAGCPGGPDGPKKPGTSCPGEGPGSFTLGPDTAKHTCGGGGENSQIKTSIDFGCVGKGNAMLDVTFAIIRFLSNGVGLVIIGSLIWGGIQYSGSRGDPQATALAVNRLQSTFFALLLFIFAYALLNFLIPGRILR